MFVILTEKLYHGNRNIPINTRPLKLKELFETGT
jgi:hypothetical protein